MRTLQRLSSAALAAACVGTVVIGQQPPAPGQPATAQPIAGGQVAPASPGRSTNLGSDPNGNPLRLALKTGHVSNYDEAKVGTYTLPDPLRLQSGEVVRDAATWTNRRRPEVLKLYQNEIYGTVPANAPNVRFEAIEPGTPVLEGVATRKHIVMHFGDQPDGPKANVVVYLPAHATKPVPVLLHLVFFAGLPSTL